jgi:hypothetical protein
MTQEQFNARFQKLLDDEDFNKSIKDRAARLVSSGAVDLDDYGDGFRLPKIILYAVLKEISNQYLPLTPQEKKTVKNLEYFG